MPTPEVRRPYRALAVLTLALAAAAPSSAGEGGGSHYMPGTMGDFGMALVGPKGFYVRNDTTYFRGDIGPVTIGNRVYLSASQRAWVNTFKTIYLSDTRVLGGRLCGVVSIPLVLDAFASGELLFPAEAERSGSRSGFGDVALTAFVNWTSGNRHLTTGMNLYVPLGSYEEGRIINLGRNYWSFNPYASFTWYEPGKGHELSAVTGLMFNTTNGATDYSSGTEWHLDFMFAQHLSNRVSVGLAGYVLRGLSDDSGPVLDRANVLLPLLGKRPLGGFRAEGFGLGPAAVVTVPIGGKPVNLTAKYLFDVAHQNRPNSGYLELSASLKL